MNIRKTIKTISLAVIALAAGIANADSGYRATKTFEAMAETIRIPVSTSGTISLRECDDCQFHSVRVSPETQYRINQKDMQLGQFRIAIQQLTLEHRFSINVRRDEATQTASIVFVYVN